jgi:hypothetical protein
MFGTTADNHGSGVHPINIIEKGDHGHDRGWGAYIWAIIIFVVFLFVVFLAFALIFKRDDRNHANIAETLTPLMTAAMLNKGHDRPYYAEYPNGGREHWDIIRDDAKHAMEMAKYFFDQQKDTLLGFKQSEILGMQNTQSLTKEICSLRDELKEDKLREQGSRINFLETVMALAPKPVMPSYPVYSPSPYPMHPPCPA